MNRSISSLILISLCFGAFPSAFARSAEGGPIVFCYHDIISDVGLDAEKCTQAKEQKNTLLMKQFCGFDTDVSVSQFTKQMEAIKASGANVISIPTLSRNFDNRNNNRDVLITFDDGYEGVLTYAVPILKKLGLKATLFVHTASIGVKAKEGVFGGKNHLSYAQLKAIEEEGDEQGTQLFRVYSHSVHHANLGRISDYDLERELLHSKDELEQVLGKGRHYFAYPYGVFMGPANGADPYRVVQAVKKAGYRMAFALQVLGQHLPEGASAEFDRFHVPRFLMTHTTSLEEFSSILNRTSK